MSDRQRKRQRQTNRQTNRQKATARNRLIEMTDRRRVREGRERERWGGGGDLGKPARIKCKGVKTQETPVVLRCKTAHVESMAHV